MQGVEAYFATLLVAEFVLDSRVAEITFRDCYG
jgi:hypothetical protein